jgi:glycerol-3-phosphate dehydrogenase
MADPAPSPPAPVAPSPAGVRDPAAPLLRGLARRQATWGTAQRDLLDVVVVGGGSSGASIVHRLAALGYRVLLVDERDYGGGTSQASAMMVWGGVLYLRSLDIPTVCRLSAAREALLGSLPGWVTPATFAYLPRRGDWRPLPLLRLAFALYRLLGRRRRAASEIRRDLSAWGFLRPGAFTGALLFEEARLVDSDARFVAALVLAARGQGALALNYCAVTGGRHLAGAREWRLAVRDQLSGQEAEVRARLVVVAAGVWTDALHARLAVESPYAHVLSKGVFLTLPRDPRHRVPLVFECGAPGRLDAMPFVPWGPVALWGPSETPLDGLEAGFSARPADVRFLLDQLNRHLATPVSAADVVSLRCGVRALAVRRGASATRDSLALSRRVRLHRDPARGWLAVYGGKLTDCLVVADLAAAAVADALGRRPAATPAPADVPVPVPPEPFPGLEAPVPAPAWCVAEEDCWSLDDYLRRRTNLAQWVPRGGLGRRDEHRARLERIARVVTGGDPARTAAAVQAYAATVRREVDEVLAACEGGDESGGGRRG